MANYAAPHVCAMQIKVKNRFYEVYWNGSGIVPFVEQAKVYSRQEALRVSSMLVNKGKLFYAKEIM